jgi:hypothetical protein
MTDTRGRGLKAVEQRLGGAARPAARLVDGRGDGEHERAAELERGAHEAASQALLV